MFSASHASTDNHISKLSLTELTCSQSHYIFYVCIYLVMELKCLAKSPPLYRDICTGSTLLCIQHSELHLDHAIQSDGKSRLYAFQVRHLSSWIPMLVLTANPFALIHNID